jgi:hypothetical protein
MAILKKIIPVIPFGGDALRYLGLIVFLIGYLFMVWAPLHLGKQFSVYVTIQEGHELITDGPFRHEVRSGFHCRLHAPGRVQVGSFTHAGHGLETDGS